MDKHLDALGYLLAAIVFSVGFLSTRIHSSLDSLIHTVGERSRSLRDEIVSGRRVGPSDLADQLRAIHRSTDYIARGSRLLNWSIFATTCAVLGDAIGLKLADVNAPDDEMALLALLFVAGLAVVAFSEFDVRRVSVERRAEITGSTLGRVQDLEYAISRANIPAAKRQIVRLKSTLPMWSLLEELTAYVDLLEHNPQRGLTRVESLIETARALYVSPVVGAACCLELGKPATAIALLSHMEARGDDISNLRELSRALAIGSGHLPVLLSAAEPMAVVAPYDERNRSDEMSVAGRIARRRMSGRGLDLALEPAVVPQTAGLMKLADGWDGTGSPLDLELNSADVLRDLVRFVMESPPETLVEDVLGPYSESRHDPALLETLGLMACACAEPRVALGYLESAIRLAPAAARSHWGRAMACHDLGWFDAAMTSLQRAVALSAQTPLFDLTKRYFADPNAVSASGASKMYSRIDDIDRFELALLGIEMDAGSGASRRAVFARALIALTLSRRKRMTRG